MFYEKGFKSVNKGRNKLITKWKVHKQKITKNKRYIENKNHKNEDILKIIGASKLK